MPTPNNTTCGSTHSTGFDRHCGDRHGVSVSAGAADNAFIRASEGILMSRNMDIKDQVAGGFAGALRTPRGRPDSVVALNETSEPVRRAAARGLWTIAQKDNPEEAASAQAAFPALRIALGDSSVSVAMNAAGALERLGEPVAAVAEARRKALRTSGPYAYERFLAARGLTGIDPALLRPSCSIFCSRNTGVPLAGQHGRPR